MTLTEERSLLVLYGSQTGCAQEVAERIAWEGKRRLFRVRLAGMLKWCCELARTGKNACPELASVNDGVL